MQSLLGLWLLALGFREFVPGRNLSWPALVLAGGLTAALVLGSTVLTNAASPTIVRSGLRWQYWTECVIGPTLIGAPFMIVATLMAARAFPTRPAIAGALCGMSAGILSDAAGGSVAGSPGRLTSSAYTGPRCSALPPPVPCSRSRPTSRGGAGSVQSPTREPTCSAAPQGCPRSTDAIASPRAMSLIAVVPSTRTALPTFSLRASGGPVSWPLAVSRRRPCGPRSPFSLVWLRASPSRRPAHRAIHRPPEASP